MPWIPVDPGDEAAAETFPLYTNATPLVVDVRAGETLFLPALWFHKVEQIGWVMWRPRNRCVCVCVCVYVCVCLSVCVCVCDRVFVFVRAPRGCL